VDGLEEHLPTIVNLNIKGRLPATTEAANMAKHCARRMRMGMTKRKSSPSLPFLGFGYEDFYGVTGGLGTSWAKTWKADNKR
jgi:hypothetical protein